MTVRCCLGQASKQSSCWTAIGKLSAVMEVSMVVNKSLACMQSSLEDLNKKVPQPMDMNRFRPNIVIDGSVPAWDEDNWQSFLLGSGPDRAVKFHSLKPCSRCKVHS